MVLVRSGNTQKSKIPVASRQRSVRVTVMADACHFHFHFRSYKL